MRYIHVLSFLIIAANSQAQSWQRYIENPFNFGGAEAYGIRVIDDTIYVSSVFVVTDSVANNRAVISKHSMGDGELLDYAQFKNDTLQNSSFNAVGTGYNQLYECGEDKFYMSIGPYSDDSDSANKMRFLIIDRYLEIVQDFPIQEYIGDRLCNINGTRKDIDGNILLYGSRSKTGQYFQGDSANTLLVKMTPQGEQLWTKKYDDSYTINSLAPLSDGDIIFNAGWVTTLQNNKRLIKTNSLGEEQWRITFGGMATGSLSTMIETSTGKILAANSWNVNSSEEPGTGWWYKKWIQLQLIEDLGNDYFIDQDVKWAPSFQTTDVCGIEEMDSGNFLMWGTRVDTTGGIFNEDSSMMDIPAVRGFLFIVDESLDSLWLRSYFYPDDDPLEFYNTFRITDVDTFENGGFVTCGWAQIEGENDLEKVWLMRLDQYGCLEPGCQNIDVTEIVLGFENSMSVFPNPVSDLCTIAWSVENIAAIEKNFSQTELIITDTQGREMQRLPISNFGTQYQKQIDMGGFASGVYQVHWVSGGSWLDTVQVVKE